MMWLLNIIVMWFDSVMILFSLIEISSIVLFVLCSVMMCL